MTMLTRSAAVQELYGRLKGWMALGGIAAVDSPSQLGGPLDDALRQLGVAEGALSSYQIPDEQAKGFRALATYYALLLVRDQAGPLVDVNASGAGVEKKRSQAGAQLEARIARAQAEAAPWLQAEEDAALYSGVLQLDILEPPQTGRWP